MVSIILLFFIPNRYPKVYMHLTFKEIFMSEKEYAALRSALASSRMEGFRVTEQTENDCMRLLTGEISVADIVKEIMARPAKTV